MIICSIFELGLLSYNKVCGIGARELDVAWGFAIGECREDTQ